MYLYDEDGLRYEVEADDVELEADGSGFWLLNEDGEDEDFYEFCADEGDE